MIFRELEPCLPPIWARSGHLQTILGHGIPSPLLQPGKRFVIQLPDGDALAGEYHAGTSATIVYLFHGLSGNTDSGYIHRTARLCLSLGHGVVRMNHRGCGAGAGLASRPYHSGCAEDLSAVFQWGRAQFPAKRRLAIGFSLSGNALLLLLAQGNEDAFSQRALPDAAIAVNAPIHLESASRNLCKGWNRLYDYRFVRDCQAELKARAQRCEERSNTGRSEERLRALNEQRFPVFTSVHEFDQRYTAPAAGFVDREDYYARCSTVDLLSRIRTPTILLTAADDPFVDVGHYRRAVLSDSIYRHIEPHGGHMGYLSRQRTPLGTRRWQDYAVGEFLKGLS